MVTLDSIVSECVAKIVSKVPYLSTEYDMRMVRTEVNKALSIVDKDVSKLTRLESIKLVNKVVDAYLESMVIPGRAEGVLAATGIAEISTQMSMKTIHNSGSATSRKFIGGFKRLQELTNATKISKNSLSTLIPSKKMTFAEVFKLLPDVEYSTLGKFIIGNQVIKVGSRTTPDWYTPFMTVYGKRIPSGATSYLEVLLDPYLLYKYKVLISDIYKILLSDPVISNVVEIFMSSQCGYKTIYDNKPITACTLHFYVKDSDVIGNIFNTLPSTEVEYAYLTQMLLPYISDKYIKGMKDYIKVFPTAVNMALMVTNIKTIGENQYQIILDNIMMSNYGISITTIRDYITSQFPSDEIQWISDTVAYTNINLSTELKNYFANLDTVADLYQEGDRVKIVKNDTKMRKYKLTFVNVIDSVAGSGDIITDNNPDIIYVMGDMRTISKIPIFLLYKKQNEDFSLVEVECEDSEGNNKMKMIPLIPDIDPLLSYSNNLNEIMATLGIEAVYTYLMEELSMCVTVERMNLEVIVNNMLYSGSVAAINRFGFVLQDNEPLRATGFEVNTSEFIKVSIGGETDKLRSITAAMIVGKPLPTGTGYIQTFPSFK